MAKAGAHQGIYPRVTLRLERVQQESFTELIRVNAWRGSPSEATMAVSISGPQVGGRSYEQNWEMGPEEDRGIPEAKGIVSQEHLDEAVGQ
jgi:hypothetical protein